MASYDKFKAYMLQKDEYEKEKSKLVDELFNDAYISHLLSKYNLDTKFVNDNLLLLLSIKDSNTPCLSCKGYLECKQSPKGNKKSMCQDEDGEWIQCYEKCSFYREVSAVIEGYTKRDFPDEWLFNNIATLKPDSIDKRISSLLLSIIAKPTRGVYLYGSTGTGKSYLAAALSNSIILTRHYSAAFVNVREFIGDCLASFKEEPGFANQKVEEYKNADILVLDDLGGEKISEWSTYQVLYEIISYRMRNKKITIFTSMYSMHELMRVYGGYNEKTKRFVDCISTLAVEQEVAGVNYYKL